MRKSSLFGLMLGAVALLGACKHVPTDKEVQGAQIHYDLGVQAQQTDPQTAYREFEQALEMDPSLVEAHNALGVLYHLAFHRDAEAISHYQRAIALRPGFSEAKVNLANVFLDEKRYDEAISLYQQALNDMLYATPFIAQGNLGWALYQKGDAAKGIDQIKAALTTNSKFCLGYRNLGAIYSERGDTELACKQLGKYREYCPDVADAHFREGVCLAKLGQTAAAKASFQACVSKATGDALRDDCKRLDQQLSP